jgi:hypothetical protein
VSPYERRGGSYCSDSDGNTAFARREVTAGTDGKDEAAVEALCTADPKCVALAYLSPGKYVLYTDTAAGPYPCTRDCAENDWQSDRALVTSALCQGDPAPGTGAGEATVPGASRGRALAMSVPPRHHAHGAAADRHARGRSLTTTTMPTPLCGATTKPECKAKPENVLPSTDSNGGGAANTPQAGLEANPDPSRSNTDFQNGITQLEKTEKFQETTMRSATVVGPPNAKSLKWLAVFAAVYLSLVVAGVIALWCFPQAGSSSRPPMRRR